MGRQFRTPHRGGGHVGNSMMSNAGPSVVTTTSSAIQIPNYGYTDIGGGSTAGEYVLDTPSEGILKVLACVSSTSGARVVRFSTTGTVSCGTLAGTTGSAGGTQITFNATVDQTVMLLGINSTHWAILSMWPANNSNSTGIVLAAT